MLRKKATETNSFCFFCFLLKSFHFRIHRKSSRQRHIESNSTEQKWKNLVAFPCQVWCQNKALDFDFSAFFERTMADVSQRHLQAFKKEHVRACWVVPRLATVIAAILTSTAWAESHHSWPVACMVLTMTNIPVEKARGDWSDLICGKRTP